MRRLRRQEGMTLIEILIAMSLMLIILAATITVFSTMWHNSDRTQRVNDLQERTRLTVDTMAKQMRNLASRADNVSHPIDRADADDVIFSRVATGTTAPTLNPSNIERLRYCMDNNGVLYQQTQTLADASTAAPSSGACPASNWTATRQLATGLTNGVRPVFDYLKGSTTGAFTSASDLSGADLDLIVGLRTTLYVDTKTTDTVPESTLSTRVFLRNQNQKPTASFIATPSTGMSLQLNGGDSEDPEGARLTFQWYDDLPTSGRKIGEGSVFLYSATAGSHKIWLKVTDPAGNFAVTATQSFTCDTTSGCHS